MRLNPDEYDAARRLSFFWERVMKEVTLREYIVKNMSQIPIEDIASNLNLTRVLDSHFRDSSTKVWLDDYGNVSRIIDPNEVVEKPAATKRRRRKYPAQEAKPEPIKKVSDV